MVYDRDLKWLNRASWVFVCFNGGFAIGNALHHEWLVAGACAGWCGGLWVWRLMLKSWQRTRDMLRLNDAVFSQLLTIHSDGKEV